MVIISFVISAKLNSTNNHLQNKAFTLVELLVTIAVLFILAAFSVQNFQLYRNNAYIAELNTVTHHAITAGQAGLTDGRYGVFNSDVNDETYEYARKFPGLVIPGYMQMYGVMNNIPFTGAPAFYFTMQHCRTTPVLYNNFFGTSVTNSQVEPGYRSRNPYGVNNCELF